MEQCPKCNRLMIALRTRTMTNQPIVHICPDCVIMLREGVLFRAVASEPKHTESPAINRRKALG